MGRMGRTGTNRGRARRLSVAAAVAAMFALGACSGPADAPAEGAVVGRTSGPPAPSPSGSASPRPARTSDRAGCVATTLALLGLEQRVGLLFMVGVPVDGASGHPTAALAERHVGAVVLVGTTEEGREAVRAVVDDVRTGVGAATLVAVDQEGGQVRRLRGPGFAPMPSAAEQAGWSNTRLQAQARRWGRELSAAGVDVDLAPVADVVPRSVGTSNAPIGALGRGYGSDPGVVAGKVAAVVSGLRAGGVQATLKHFPGLGRVQGNTDFSGGVVDRATRRRDPLLAPFAAGVRAGAEWLMVSSATYPRIDPSHQAVFSSRVIDGAIRADLAFPGVVVSDDIGAAAAVRGVSAPQRAVRFLRAGGDVVLTVDPGVLPQMHAAVLAAARGDGDFAAAVEGKARRVLIAQQRAGLLRCAR